MLIGVHAGIEGGRPKRLTCSATRWLAAGVDPAIFTKTNASGHWRGPPARLGELPEGALTGTRWWCGNLDPARS